MVGEINTVTSSGNMPTKNELKEIWNETKPWLFHKEFGKYLDSLQDEKEEPHKKKGTRTNQQSRAMWLQHQKVADELIKTGVTMRKIFESTESFDIPPTKDNVHELWLYFQKIMYPTMPSTKDLPKHGDHYQKIHDVMMKNLGEKWGIDYIDFPCDDNKPSTLQNIEDARNIKDYPEYNGEPTI